MATTTDRSRVLNPTWLVLLAVALLSFFFNASSVHLGRLFVVAAFGFLSTRTLRNMALFGWIAAPAVAANIGQWLERRAAPVQLRGERRRRGTPARDAGIEGRPFNCMIVGGLLTWRLFPQQPVFIDGRTEAYPEALFASYFDVIDHPPQWPALASRYTFDYALLDHTAIDRWPLARYLASEHGWTLAYHDETAAIFLPTDDGHRAMRERAEHAFSAIEARRREGPLRPEPGLVRRLVAFPVMELQLAIGYGDFLRFIGRNMDAVRTYQHALVLDPESLDVRLALGGAYWSGGKRDDAMDQWREILRRDPTFAPAAQALAQAGAGR